jgi:uncharacterized membrane protein YesL
VRLTWQVTKLAVLDFIEELFLLMVFNLLWVVGALLVLPFPFATAGLAWVAAEIGQGKAIHLRTFFDGGRRYWKPAYIWGLINLVVWTLLWVNISFYSGLNSIWSVLVRALMVSIAIIWGAVQLYVFPLLIRQEVPSLKLALRNGLVLMSLTPVLTIGVIILAVVLLVLSSAIALLLFVFYFAFLAVLTNRAVGEALKVEAGRNTE